MAGTKIDNKVKESYIKGDFIGRDQYNYYLSMPYLENPFKDNIFLHYNGDKISKFLFPHSNRIEFVRKTNKLAIALFDNIYISLSDLVQSPFIYDDFFKQALSFEEEPLFTVIGTKINQNIDEFFDERDKLYFKTGFYKTFHNESQEIKDTIIKYDNTVPKRFETKSFISCSWKENLSLYNGKVNSMKNVYLKNAVMNITGSLHTDIDKIISIPDRLNKMPFIWDSIQYLSLEPKYINEIAKENIEIFLVSEWVRCYIENLSCKIFNAIIGCNDCSLGIEDCFDFKSLIVYLKRFKLLDYLLNLSFEELVWFRMSSEKSVLQECLSKCLRNFFIIKDQVKVQEKTNKIYAGNSTVKQKLKDEILLLFEEMRDLSYYGK